MSLPSNEPVLVGAAVSAALTAAVAFIPGITPAEIAGAGTLSSAFVSLFVRGAVTPVALATAAINAIQAAMQPAGAAQAAPAAPAA